MALIAIVLMSVPGMANEAAERRIIGFSPEGRYFAFEQFGIHDGSGFPYADIFIIDLVKDKWVKNTPVRVSWREESLSSHEVRKQAHDIASPILEKLKISRTGRLIISRQIGELGAPAKSIIFKPDPVTPPERIHTIRLEVFDLQPDKSCQKLVKTSKGFALTLLQAKGKAREFYRDKIIPKSRGCSLDYGFSDIIAYDLARGGTVYVALISVFQKGFEGPDRRFLAMHLPVKPPKP